MSIVMAYACVKCDVIRTKIFPEDWDKNNESYTNYEICIICGSKLVYVEKSQFKKLGISNETTR